MLREACLIIMNKLYIFMVHLKKLNLYICIRYYVKIKFEKFRWFHANSPLTTEQPNLSANFSNKPDNSFCTPQQGVL